MLWTLAVAMVVACSIMAVSYSTWTEYSDIQKQGSEVQFESIDGMRAGAIDGGRRRCGAGG
jgi:hypothetical protein